MRGALFLTLKLICKSPLIPLPHLVLLPKLTGLLQAGDLASVFLRPQSTLLGTFWASSKSYFCILIKVNKPLGKWKLPAN
jgi:hypothetical protein